jgi:hypothetical protein
MPMTPTEKLQRLEAIAGLARRTRAAQRTYFRTRAQGDLQASKEIEQELDRELKSFDQDAGPQASLFTR